MLNFYAHCAPTTPSPISSQPWHVRTLSRTLTNAHTIHSIYASHQGLVLRLLPRASAREPLGDGTLLPAGINQCTYSIAVINQCTYITPLLLSAAHYAALYITLSTIRSALRCSMAPQASSRRATTCRTRRCHKRTSGRYENEVMRIY
jgi:hypothetical protein